MTSVTEQRVMIPTWLVNGLGVTEMRYEVTRGVIGHRRH